MSRAVASVLEQELSAAEFELIVVNDSGQPLPEENWQQSAKVRVVNTNRRERSVARNCGAALAIGKYLHFLDDDDWLLPGALESLRRLVQANSHAAWVHGGVEIVDNGGKSWAEINFRLRGNCFAQVVGGAWAPIPASLIRSRVFHVVGGFDPLVNVTEDLDLCRRIALVGEFASTDTLAAAVSRDSSWESSTNYQIGPATNKLTRDRVLAQLEAFGRLRVSAHGSFWHGRVLRIYIGSVILNLSRLKLAAALERSFNTLRFALLSIPKMLNPDFWKALRMEHVPGALHHVLLSMERPGASDRHVPSEEI